jgi:hypothetical protein
MLQLGRVDGVYFHAFTIIAIKTAVAIRNVTTPQPSQLFTL